MHARLKINNSFPLNKTPHKNRACMRGSHKNANKPKPLMMSGQKPTTRVLSTKRTAQMSGLLQPRLKNMISFVGG